MLPPNVVALVPAVAVIVGAEGDAIYIALPTVLRLLLLVAIGYQVLTTPAVVEALPLKPVKVNGELDELPHNDEPELFLDALYEPADELVPQVLTDTETFARPLTEPSVSVVPDTPVGAVFTSVTVTAVDHEPAKSSRMPEPADQTMVLVPFVATVLENVVEETEPT